VEHEVHQAKEPKLKKKLKTEKVEEKPKEKSKKVKNTESIVVEENKKPNKKVPKEATKPEVVSTKEPETAEVPKKKKASKNKSERFNKKQKEVESKPGVIYVAHLPYGFVEDGIKSFFSQYGEVKNVALARSSKTTRSKGYAFVEFDIKEVAEIAAKAIHGYMMYGKELICKMVEGDGIKVSSKKFRFIPWRRKFIQDKNKEKTEPETKKEVKHLIKKEQLRKEKFAQLGIKYDYPGFSSLISQV